MKVKNKIIGTILGVIASSLVFISVPETANAGDCSAEDPCQTWAVIDNGGRVINTIVCQPSVCGSGVWERNRVVLQVPANPITHQSQGGYYNPEPKPGEPDRTVSYNEQEKTFSQEGTTWSAPQVNTAVVDTTTLTAIINPDGIQSNPATISATQGEFVETKDFNQPKTREQFEESIQESVILKKHLNKFFELLRGWIIN